MSLPLNALSPAAVISAWIAPDDVSRLPATVDYETGGIGLNDPSQGLLVQTWRARVSGNDVLVGPAPYTSETVVVTAAGITELSLCFDQNMRPALAYMQAGQAKLLWFDTFLGMQVITTLDVTIKSLFLTMDDKRSIATTVNFNDMLLFYIKGSTLCYRQQRDRFATERVLQTFAGPNVRIYRCGMGAGQRVQIEVVGVDAAI